MFTFDTCLRFTHMYERVNVQKIILISKAHYQFMESRFRHQSERNILLEYRLFECRYVTLKLYTNMHPILVSVYSKIL